MTTDFQELNLRPELAQAVAELGYTEPTPIQTAIIPMMITGLDVIGQAQTGTGKTAAFALPILQNLDPEYKKIQALVMTPTRELAIQVSNAVYEYGQHLGVKVLAVYGGQPYGRQINRLERGVNIVVGTPGRLLDLMRQKALDLSGVKTVVLDEGDEMLSMGFIEDIEAILEETPTTRQTALFSATMPAAIRRLADRYQHDPQHVSIQREQVTVAAIEQRYYLVNQADKAAALTRLVEVEAITSALIFVRTRAGTSELADELESRGYAAEILNGDLTQEVRERVLNRFRQNQIKVLVATDVAARGLDIEDISHIFNYDLPEDEEIYVHRIGRTGRAGKTGIAISLVTPAEQWRLRKIETFTKQKLIRGTLPTEEEIITHREAELREKMIVWLERARFKRERALVANLIEEGYDPADVAAAALRIARAEEKQKPVAHVREVEEFRSRKNDRGPRQGINRRVSSRGSESHEDGMVRLSISRGRTHGIRPSDVVSTIARNAGIPGYTIGKIHIQDRVTLVDVP
ncbi:MAG: DEAD/DEAH box helicase, partial [Chloroflexi bacterium]